MLTGPIPERSYKDEHGEWIIERPPVSRGTIDNALTAAFRVVFGWCPLRDGLPPGVGIIKYTPHVRGPQYVSDPPRPLPIPHHIQADPFVNGERR